MANVDSVESVEPLIEACRSGDSARVILLLRNNICSIDQVGVDGDTPLGVACTEGNLRIVSILIQRGADVNLSTPIVGARSKQRGGESPLYIASDHGHLPILALLIASGAKIDHPIPRSSEQFHRTLEDEGCTPLIAACRKGHLDLVSYLIQMGASVDGLEHVETPLCWVCFHGSSRCTLETDRMFAVVKLLLDNGADVNRPDPECMITPLWSACYGGYLDIVTLLIDWGASIDSRDKEGSTPLMVACNYGYDSIVELLIRKGALLENFQSSVPYKAIPSSPLLVACLRGFRTIIRTLLAAGANANRPRGGKNHDIRPLSVLYALGDIDSTKALLERGAAVDQIPPPTLDLSPASGIREIKFYPPQIPPDILSRQQRIVELLIRTRSRRTRIRTTVKLSIDRLHKQGYWEVVSRTPNNDLPPYRFVFKVVEMMKMCGMQPLAEELIEFLGNC